MCKIFIICILNIKKRDLEGILVSVYLTEAEQNLWHGNKYVRSVEKPETQIFF